MTSRVLIVDDDASFRQVMAYHLAEAGFQVELAQDGEDGLRAFRKSPYPVVVTDLKMPKLDGVGLLQAILRISPDTYVVVVTAFGDVGNAVEAMKKGARDFIPKPMDRDHFLLAVRRGLEHAALRSEVNELRKQSSASREIVSSSAAMEQVLETIDRVADSGASVMLLGESGTGKELLARRLHRLSDRRDGPFVVVNCAAIPGELLESELFGHRKGAFTGAVKDHKGKFQLAHQGTLFLDEIGEMPSEMQPRLLRALQERAVDVVGGDGPVQVDVRILSATNLDLVQEVKAGRFREDLFYRLHIVPITIPPLRSRPEDIVPLAEFFISRFGAGRPRRLTKTVIERLESYSWPGNVRELENVCQRLVLLSRDEELSVEWLPDNVVPSISRSAAEVLPGTWVSLPADGVSLNELEKAIIIQALERTDNNQSAAARFLRIPRHKLLYRMEKFGIEMPDSAGDKR